jgi:uracil-DNA glycosylase family 4
MGWTERQRSMLQEMGIRLWLAEPVEAGLDADLSSTEVAPTAELAFIAKAAVDAAFAPRSAPAVSHVSEPAVAWSRPIAAAPPAAPVRSTFTALSPAEMEARATAIAAMDGPALRDDAARCTACPLCEGRTRSVFASATGQARWVVVGDPPSAQDDRDGTPLTGDAGRLLDAMLRAVHLSRADVALPEARACVTPIVKCRPPGDRAAEPAEMAACAPYLKRQLELAQPSLVLAMGRCATQGLLQSDQPVGKLRGQVHRVHGLPLVATFNPAHLARHPADKAKAWDDLCRAVGAAEASNPA